MTYPVVPADVEARWRPLSAEETVVATTFIDDLLQDLDLLRPSLAAFYATLVDPALTVMNKAIKRTIALRVKAALRNPDTLNNTSIDAQGGVAVGYDNQILDLKATEAVLSDGDLAMIDRAVAAAGGTAYTHWRSVQLAAHSELCPPGDMSILPTP